MSIGNRLKEIRTSLGMTQREMAELLDIAQNNLHRYENDLSKLSSDKFERLHNKDVNIHWLLSGEGKMFRDDSSDTSLISSVRIPVRDVRASAGDGFINYIDSINNYISIPEFILPSYTNIKNLEVIEIFGTSMEPTINNGEMAIIDIGIQEVQSGAIYLIRIFDELRVKRLNRKMNGNIIIMSDNPLFPQEELTPEQLEDSPINIIGIVIVSFKNHIGRNIGFKQVR